MHHLAGKAHRPEIIVLVVAILVFLIGVLVYSIDRSPAQVYFLSDWMSLGNANGSVFGALGSHLPTFIHVFSFILLTMAIVVPRAFYRQYLLPVCIGWLVFDSACEIAQLDFIGSKIAAWTPGWFEHVPFLENVASYFKAGTFDVLDLISIVLGAFSAYLTMRLIIKRSEGSANPV